MVSIEEARENRKAMWPVVICILCLGSLLMVILLPLSFSKIEYHEVGLVAQKSTGDVNKDKVWGPGNHFIGPDFEFKVFPSSLQLFDQSISVWSKASAQDAGTTLVIDVSFQYRIRTSEIADLYEKVALGFEPLVITYALDAIKNTAPLYGVDEYLSQRQAIESALKVNVTSALAVNMHMDVIDLQLRRIVLTDDYKNIKLAAALQVENNAMEVYTQQKETIEEETSLAVLVINNEALTVENAAIAEANLITERAVYLSKQHIEEQRATGLKLMLEELGINGTAGHEASLDYITSLINNANKIKPYVNIDNGILRKSVA